MNKKVDYEYLLREKHFSTYQEETDYILGLIKSGKISPVRASGTNGKKPALYNRYWLHQDDEDNTKLLEEINFRLCPRIRTDYYKNKPGIYRKERYFVLSLNEWLETRSDGAETASVNERSFEIWGREKFLSGQKTDGVTAADVLKHCGISREELKVYDTVEPFACFTYTRETPQNILILENLDPFYGLRKYLTETGGEIFEVKVGSLIYGGGKRVVRSFEDFELSAEPYLLERGNHFFYAGDLDYEGIGIYESLLERVEERMEILPFTAYYDRMLRKASVIKHKLPPMKEGQIPVVGERFFPYFTDTEAGEIKRLLSEGLYIPQEILSLSDYVI